MDTLMYERTQNKHNWYRFLLIEMYAFSAINYKPNNFFSATLEQYTHECWKTHTHTTFFSANPTWNCLHHPQTSGSKNHSDV